MQTHWIGEGMGMVGNAVGGAINAWQQGENRAAQAKANADNAALQREFAQHGIRWRVQDAVAAGISPLAALGAGGAAASPSFQVGAPDSSIGDAVSSMGQNIGRAVSATQTKEEREVQQLQIASARLDLEGKEIENAIKASQLSRLMAPASAPMAGSENFIPGQSSGALVKTKPLEKTVSSPGRAAQEAGWRPDVSYARTDTGLVPMIPESLSESLEDDMIGSLLWRVRNQLMPNVTGEGKPSKTMLPKGYTDWSFSFGNQEWIPVKGKGSYPGKKAKQWIDSIQNKLRPRR